MDSSVIIIMMMVVSITLGGLGLVAFLWGIRNGQFDDKEKMMNAVLFDDESELNDAYRQEQKKAALKKKEKPAKQ